MFDKGDLNRILRDLSGEMCRCVPFLGAGVNVTSAVPAYQGLPLGSHLTERFLAEPYFDFVGRDADRENLAKVAQQFEMTSNRLDLTNFLKRQIPDDDFEPSPLLRTLARLPFRLIVTTNYDRLMERALRLEGKTENVDFITVVQPPSGWDLLDDAGAIERFDDWTAFPGTVVYKIHGSFHGTATLKEGKWIADAAPPPVVITEEDYITFMTVMGASNPERVGIPPFVRARMANSMLLFLGYGLEDWDIRAMYSGLIQSIPDYQRRDSYAIQRNAPNLWKDFWSKRHVLVRNHDLYDFAASLHEGYFKAKPDWIAAPGPALPGEGQPENP